MDTTVKELTMEELKNIFGHEVKIVREHKTNPLKSKFVGDTFKINNTEFVILDMYDGCKALAITKDFILNDEIFDKNTNNYKKSSLRNKVRNFGEEIATAVGKNNTYKPRLDLTSDDGLDDYGYVDEDYAGLLTCDMYRRYNKILEKFPVDNWWWTLTPYSTPYRGIEYSVRFVYGDGQLNGTNCGNGRGVRPFLIFDSNILVS